VTKFPSKKKRGRLEDKFVIEEKKKELPPQVSGIPLARGQPRLL
jgi:hypothetical protein